MISKTLLHSDPELVSLRSHGAGNMTIDELKLIIEKACTNYGLNVIVSTDVITSGRIFDKSKTDCITITNAEHQKDYFIEVITMKTQGLYAFFDFYYTGTSKNNRRMAEGDMKHSTITGSIIGAIKKATVSNDAMETETNYYSMLCDAIRSVIN